MGTLGMLQLISAILAATCALALADNLPQKVETILFFSSKNSCICICICILLVCGGREQERAHEQLGCACGHVPLLVQLQTCGERALDLPQREEAGHPGQPNYPDDCRRHGLQSEESPASHCL